MAQQTRIILGPPTAHVSKEQAEEKLKTHPNFPKSASYALEEVEGRWVAAFTTQSAPPFGGGDEGDSAANDSAPTPPGDEAPSGPPGEESTNDDKDEKSPFGDKDGEGDGKEKGGHGELAKLEHMLQTLLTALGLGGPDASMMPGDEVPGGPDAGGPVPPGAEGHDPTAPPGGGDDEGDRQTVRHERSLKPGEAPPGTTPVGSPAFAAVRIPDDHPWKQSIAGGAQEWVVSDYMADDEPIGVIARELKSLAEPYGYKVKQLREGRDTDGNRVARARIARVG